MDESPTTRQFGELLIAHQVLALVVVEFLAQEFSKLEDPKDAVRALSGRVHGSIDRMGDPDGMPLKQMLEISRQEIDRVMRVISLRLQE